MWHRKLFDTNNIVSKEILKSGRYSNNIIEFSKKEEQIKINFLLDTP